MRTSNTTTSACFWIQPSAGSLVSAYAAGVPSTRLTSTETATTKMLL